MFITSEICAKLLARYPQCSNVTTLTSTGGCYGKEETQAVDEDEPSVVASPFLVVEIPDEVIQGQDERLERGTVGPHHAVAMNVALFIVGVLHEVALIIHNAATIANVRGVIRANGACVTKNSTL